MHQHICNISVAGARAQPHIQLYIASHHTCQGRDRENLNIASSASFAHFLNLFADSESSNAGLFRGCHSRSLKVCGKCSKIKKTAQNASFSDEHLRGRRYFVQKLAGGLSFGLHEMMLRGPTRMLAENRSAKV